jgi:thiol-disulfide isomerase/thioredoxin
MTFAALILAVIAMPSPSSVLSEAEARGEPIMLNFTTNWCGYCKQMKGTLDKLVDAGYPIRDVDGDSEADVAKRYKVSGYPTYVIIDGDGNELARTAGVRPATELAGLYQKAQGQVRSKPKTRAVANRRDAKTEEDDAKVAGDATSDEPARSRPHFKNPKPWETVVRIRISLNARAEGVGSGTIISSNNRETIILTCAHIFKDEGKPTPPAAQFRKPIKVDLFDGQLGGRGNAKQVHFRETVEGEAIDYDTTNDVGLIRIRPGKVLPAARVVPPSWTPGEGMEMTTVGCSEGRDATAWSTRIMKTNAKLKHTATNETFYVTECEHAPSQGRSGGGLFTEDGYVAGVCDFADPQHKRGLYAVPKSIYKLLDRNEMIALYDPATRAKYEPRPMLADRGNSRPKESYRGQSPDDDVPAPGRLGIEPPIVGELRLDDASPNSKRSWKPSGKLASNATSRAPREDAGYRPAEMKQESDQEETPAPKMSAADASNPNRETDSDRSNPRGPTNWKPVKKK